MTSPLLAMTWEFWQRSRWQMLLGFAIANSFPILLLSALRMDGLVDPQDPAMITIQVVLTELHIVMVGAMVIAAHELSPRQFVLPVSTPVLVVGRLVPAMLALAMLEALSFLVLNQLFVLDWPILAPVLLAPVTLAMIIAAVWLGAGTLWQPALVGVTALVIGIWYKSRTGALLSMPQHVWATVTAADLVWLAGFTVASFLVAFYAVRRMRCAEPLGAVPGLTAIRRVLRGLHDAWTRPHFQSLSGTAAFVQAEWARKGWLMPVIVAWALGIGLVPWALFDRTPKALVEGLTSGCALVPLLGLIGGLIMGQCGSRADRAELGPFLSTRPIGDWDLARGVLKVTAWACLTAWALWATVFVTAVGLVAAFGGGLEPWTSRLPWWLLPASLIGCWAAASMTAATHLAARGTAAMIGTTTLVLVLIASQLILKVAPADWRDTLIATFHVTAGVLLSLLTLALILLARRQDLIGIAIARAALGTWCGLGAIVIFECFRSQLTLSVILFLVGLSSLSVLGIAATPLAVAWNRHRA